MSSAVQALIVGYSGSPTDPLFVLPDCFFLLSNGLRNINLIHVIIQGNSASPDPLVRLTTAISSMARSFTISDSLILTPNGQQANVNWTPLYSFFTSLSSFSINNVPLGVGATFPTFPNPISNVNLVKCGLTGPLPLAIFDTMAPTLFSYVIDFQGNNLSGTIPSTFLSFPDPSIVTGFRIYGTSNQLTGSIPSSLFAGTFSTAVTIAVDLANNHMDGPLDNLFATSTFTPSKLQSFELFLSGNSFNGTVPKWTDTTWSELSRFTFECNRCNLAGSIPSELLHVSGASNQLLHVRLSSCWFSGGFPEALLNLPISPRSLTLDFSNNTLNSFPDNLFMSANLTQTSSLSLSLGSNPLTVSTSFPTFPASMDSLERNHLLPRLVQHAKIDGHPSVLIFALHRPLPIRFVHLTHA